MEGETKLTMIRARRFLLLKQGLLGEHRFIGKEGALRYVKQAGCIQFDPVDVCGRNAELSLQSRVKGFKKKHLEELLYKDRLLVDYPDKELSIFPVEDWPYFQEYRTRSFEHGRQFEGLAELEELTAEYIKEHGPVSADALPIDGEIFWHSAIHWSGNWHGGSKAARSVLEQMFTDGRLVIHHKAGTRKFYDLSERHIPARILNAEDPCPDEAAHIKWRVKRRIGAVGLLPNRRSDAFLGIPMTTEQRERAFSELEAEGSIFRVWVEGQKAPLFALSEDRPLLEAAQNDTPLKPRCEFLAPLDPFLWDRKLIDSIFGFKYTWEIYTPAEKRKYGHYVLPMIYGERFIGRIEAAAKYGEKTLIVKNIWFEEGVRQTKKLTGAVESAVKRLARFNECCAVSDLISIH